MFHAGDHSQAFEHVPWLALAVGLALAPLTGCTGPDSDVPASDPVERADNAQSLANHQQAGSQEAGAHTAGPEPGVDADALPYRHPLANPATRQAAIALTHNERSATVSYGVYEGQRGDEDGSVTRFSGVYQVERRTMSAAEREQATAEKRARDGAASGPNSGRVPVVEPKIGHKLGRWLADARASQSALADQVEVIVSLRRAPRAPLFVEVEQAVARGEIATHGDHVRVRSAILDGRRAALRGVQEPVRAAIEALGGAVVGAGDNLHFVVARMPLKGVDALAGRDDVVRVEVHEPDADEVDGTDIAAGHQIEQFIVDGYDGENIGASWDMTFAQVEGSGADDEHVGFREGTGTATRIRGMYSCGSGSCTSTSGFSTSQEGDHASAVASIIFGDLRDGQDSTYTTAVSRTDRSGYAGEARGWLYQGTSTDAFDHIAGQTGGSAAVLVNMSAGSAGADPACLGQDSRSRAANELYEAGRPLFKSAGNEYHTSSTDCTVTSPGSAIGTFTVGSLGAGSSGTETTVRAATVRSSSSRGGTSLTEGAYRSIVDLSAYGCRQRLYDKSGGYSYSGCGTSFAAPTVAATALDFIDFYKHAYSDFIDDPGVLMTNLLLFGDRSSESGSQKVSRYDNLYGAGRLRARRFDAAGMDGPWGWATGYACIDNNEVHTIDINSGAALSTDVDALVAVIWWYDARHESNGKVDDIDLLLKTTSGTTLRSSTSSYDNKERVFSSTAGGQAVKLEIRGYNVTADNAGCGSNSMRVYWAHLREDSDRDDVDGPSAADIDPL